MCLAIPGKVISIDGNTAVVDYGGARKTADISLLDCRPGDYVLVHVGFAIQKVEPKAAQESRELFARLMQDEDDNQADS